MCLKGKYVNRYFNKKINGCIISKSQDSQICNVGNNLLHQMVIKYVVIYRRDLISRKFKVMCCVYVFNMLFLNFAGNVINI